LLQVSVMSGDGERQVELIGVARLSEDQGQ
jgi:hypothetical protein